jgi:hypothetical protein
LRKKNSKIFSTAIFLRDARANDRDEKTASPRDAHKHKARESSLLRAAPNRDSFFHASPRAK